jgi:hypothetical protein
MVMTTSPMMSAADNSQLLALAYAKSAAPSAAAAGSIGLTLGAKQLDQARATLRDGETFSATA